MVAQKYRTVPEGNFMKQMTLNQNVLSHQFVKISSFENFPESLIENELSISKDHLQNLKWLILDNEIN